MADSPPLPAANLSYRLLRHPARAFETLAARPWDHSSSAPSERVPTAK